MRRRMFMRLLRGSFRNRWRSVGVAVLAVTFASALGASAAGVASGVQTKTARTLRAYGANIVVVPRSGAAIDEGDLTGLQGPDRTVTPFLYVPATSGSSPVTVAGTWFDAARVTSPWWRAAGTWIERRDDAEDVLVGAQLARSLGVRPGDRLTLGSGNRSYAYRVAGVVTTGGDEDGLAFLTLVAAQALAGETGRVSLVQVSAEPGARSLGAVVRELQAAAPDAEVKTVRQIAVAQRSVSRRVELLLRWIALVVLAAAALGVASTMTTSVLERRREVGLMKALGAPDRRVAALFLAESVGIGVAGGVLGYGLGLAMMQAIGRTALGSAVTPAAWVGPATVGAAVALSVVASLAPVRRAARAAPATALSGG